ncbi:MAG TPA: 2Fe-2S iron-sulfur cluster-binding protein, partial [Actinomycetota bacterium]|nr:2Fe-2S iron-sulfur cluster-binding protein [Actinomycetota bacterium]
MRKLEVTFRPFDKVTRVPEGTTLFNAAHWIGLPIESTCGGRGTCGKCTVQVLAGEVEVAPADRRWFSDAQLAEGGRLACEATVYADAECHVPTLMRAPKAATMGLSRFVLLEPNVHKVHLVLPGPSLEDVRSDVERIRDALDAEGYGVATDLRALRHLPIALRNASFDVTVVLCGEHLVAVEPGDTTGVSYGVAVDVGTTTVVATLMDLTTGAAAAVASNLNGQAPFGADVISRIARTRMEETAAAELQRTVVETIDGLLAQVYAAAGV